MTGRMRIDSSLLLMAATAATPIRGQDRGQDRALDRDRRFIRIHSSIRSFLFIHTTLTTRTLGNG